MNKVGVGFVITTKGTYQCSLRANPPKPGTSKTAFGQVKIMKELNNTTKLGPHIDHKRYISASHVMPDLYLSTEFAIVMYFFL